MDNRREDYNDRLDNSRKEKLDNERDRDDLDNCEDDLDNRRNDRLEDRRR